MKKIILFAVFVINIIPVFNKGKLNFGIAEIYAQGGYYTPPSSSNISYSQGSTGNVYHADGSFWYNRGDQYNYYDRGDGHSDYFDANGDYKGGATLQDGNLPNGNNYTPTWEEAMGDEDTDGGWGDDPPGGGPGEDGGSGGSGIGPIRDPRLEDCAGVYRGYAYWDKCGQCVGGTTGLLECDCNGDPGGTAYINSCGVCVGGNTGFEDRCDSSVMKYYITVGNNPKRYFKKDKIFIPQQTAPQRLIIHLQTGTFDPTNSRWLRNDSVVLTQNEGCNFNVSTVGSFEVKVDSAGIKAYTNNQVVVYNKPIIYFKRYISYEGEYGFDDNDSTFIHFKDSPRFRAGYDVRTINQDSFYKVPWMSLLHGQNAQVSLKKLGIDSSAAHDPNFSIRFVPSIQEIKIRKTPGSPEIADIPLDIAELRSLTSINISAVQWDGKNNDSLKSIESIFAITNNNDTIGRLHLSCSHPTAKKVVYIYVNSGNGYDSSFLSRTAMLTQLNKFSHNQIMRQWQIETIYVDTLNVAEAYRLFPGSFQSDSILGTFKGLYNLYSGLNLDTIFRNSPEPVGSKTYFYFITDLYIADSTFDDSHAFIGMSPISGLTADPSLRNYGALFTNLNNPSTLKTVSHEHGHAINLDHTFDPPLNIAKYGTKTNFMDYLEVVAPDTRKWFGYCQWLLIY